MYGVEDLILQITFCENQLKVIYPLLNNEEDILKIEELYINFPEDTEHDILNMEHMKLFYKYETYTEEELTKKINQIIKTIDELKLQIILRS